MAEEREYREGCDPEPEKVSKELSEESKGEWFKGADGGSEQQIRPPEMHDVPKEDERIKEDEELYTAVMIVLRHNGAVVPVTNLEHLKLHHKASPHEVLRMCHDVADQISSVRVIGEVLKAVVDVGRESSDLTARRVQQMLMGMKG
jgi:hypothetical protein